MAIVWSWPAVAYEELPWELDPAAPASRTARRRHLGSYQAALVPAISGATAALPGDVVAQAEDAAVEIARFDAELGAEIAPFSAVLLRFESVASSNIEHLTASARAIAEAELAPTGRSNAALIVANTRAMSAAVALAQRIDGKAILAMHQALLERSQPQVAGRWRTGPVWIGGSLIGPHEALFVPPHQRHVEVAVADLVRYIARDDVPVLVQAALAHAQFEAIHPFPDGNGRTGRALLHAQLRNKGLTRNVTVPVSSGLLSDTGRYFDALTAYRRGDTVPIVRGLADAAFIAVTNGRRLVVELRAIRADWSGRLRLRRGAVAWRALDVLLRSPVVNARFMAGELGIAPQNVYRVLEPLLAAEIVVEFTDKKRNQLWRASDVLDVLDAFSTWGGRRDRSP